MDDLLFLIVMMVVLGYLGTINQHLRDDLLICHTETITEDGQLMNCRKEHDHDGTIFQIKKDNE